MEKFNKAKEREEAKKSGESITRVEIKEEPKEKPSASKPLGLGYEAYKQYLFDIEGHEKIIDRECPLCQGNYIHRGMTLRHLKSIHFVVGNYPCKHCGKEFKYEKELDLHVKRCAKKPSNNVTVLVVNKQKQVVKVSTFRIAARLWYMSTFPGIQ